MTAVPALRHLVRMTSEDFDAEQTSVSDLASTAANEVDGHAEIWRQFLARI